MASFVAQSAPARLTSEFDFPVQPNIRALVVSPELEVRQPLLRTLEVLKIDTLTCMARGQAEELLADRRFDVIFCDENLPDGSYADLIRANHAGGVTRVVVTTRTGDWDLYFAALAKGAFDVIRCPCSGMDVKMTLLRVMTDEDSASLSAVV